MFGRALLKAIRFYQRGISPMTPASCRFAPTCSEYAAQAISEHGAARGAWLAVRRISRCHPFGGHGWDPVPGLRLGDGNDPVPGVGLGVGAEGEVENR